MAPSTTIFTAVPSTAGTATPTVTFASLMTAIDASVSRQVESALARALRDHSQTASSPSHSAATPSSVITIPSTSATLAGMSLLCIFRVVHCSLVHITVSFLVYHSWPSHFQVQKGTNFSSAAGLCFLPLFRTHTFCARLPPMLNKLQPPTHAHTPAHTNSVLNHPC